MDGQHQGPHDTQRVVTIRSMARAEAVGDGMASGKVFM
jgi:hypothetical protein